MDEQFNVAFFESFKVSKAFPVEVLSLGRGKAVSRDYRWVTDMHRDRNSHRDSHYTIQFTVSGAGEFQLPEKGENWQVGPGSFFMCGVDTEYCYELGDNEEWQFIWLALSGKVTGEIINDIIETHGPVVAGYSAVQSQKMLSNYIHEISVSRCINPYRLSSFGYDFLLKMYEELEVLPVNEKEFFVSRAHRFVMDYIEVVDVPMLAEYFNYHPKYFSSVCRKMSGRTPHVFIEERKMEYVSSLLIHTGKSLKEICLLTNFSTEQYLCNCFRRKFGTSPGQYRKNRTGTVYDNVIM